jgi:hypothetical protein
MWFADGRPSVRFYWDNLVSRRLVQRSKHDRSWRSAEKPIFLPHDLNTGWVGGHF